MKRSKQVLRRGGRLGLITALLIAGATVSFASEKPSEKLQKQISFFENTVSQMLVDSTNFLVANRNAAGGVYVPGYGVVVTFNASLSDRDIEWNMDNFWNNFHIQHEDGKVIVQIDDWSDKEREEVKRELKEAVEDVKKAREEAEKMRAEAEEQREQMMEEMEEHRQEKYEEGKEELVEILMDYGETLLRLNDNEHVMMAVFLNNRGWMEEERFGDNNHLVISASMGDIRAYAEGRIDEDDMRDRIDILEY